MTKMFTDLELRVRDFGRTVTRKDEGATAVEYGLMVALIAVAIIVAVAALGTNLSGLFTRVSGSVNR